MLTQLRKFPAMLFALVALVAVGCNTNDDPVDPNGTKPNTPTNVRAQSHPTSVGLMWDAPAAGVTPTGYRITHKVVGLLGTTTVDVEGATTTTATIEGLSDGVMYEFTIQAKNGSVLSEPTAAITWSPAKRTNTIRLYSKRSSQGSGLVVFSGAPRNATTASGSLWDLCFDDADPSHPLVGSPGQSSYVDNTFTFVQAPSQTAKTVYLGRQTPNVNELDDIWETSSLNDVTLSTIKESMYDLSTPAGSGGLAFVFAQKNSVSSYTFGKVLVLRNGGKFVQGTGDDQFIEVVASYQTTADVPYALKAKIDALEAQTRVKNQVEFAK